MDKILKALIEAMQVAQDCDFNDDDREDYAREVVAELAADFALEQAAIVANWTTPRAARA